jgi:hypothetical protein
MGIEVSHSEHPEAAIRHYMKLCRKNNLAFTGGSDFHSAHHNKVEIGHPRVLYSTVESLKAKLEAEG